MTFGLLPFVKGPSLKDVRKIFAILQSYSVQTWAKVDAPALVNFVPSVAFHYYLNLPDTFTEPVASNLADLCIQKPL